MKKLLCLDFDGVICDSQKECLLTSYRAYQKLINGEKKSVTIDEIPSEIVQGFFKYRHLVRPAKEYGVLMDLLNKNFGNYSSSFKDAIKQNDFPFKKFESLFFLERLKIINDDGIDWFSMQPLYENVFQSWKDILKRIETYILTNKDFISVSSLLKHNKLNFNSERIISNEYFSNKLNAIKKISIEKNIEAKQTIFVDDSIYYIKQMLEIDVDAYLAGWGYVPKNNATDVPHHRVLSSFSNILDLICI